MEILIWLSRCLSRFVIIIIIGSKLSFLFSFSLSYKKFKKRVEIKYIQINKLPDLLKISSSF